MNTVFNTQHKTRLAPLADIDICVFPVALVGDEDKEELKLSPRDRVRLRYISHPQKRREFLASRLALKDLDPDYRIEYEGRIPSLDNGAHISITHAHRVAAAMMSKNYVVGLDVEVQRQQLFRISDKFLHPEEKMKIRPDRVLEDLHVYWGAKEALFKIWKKGEVDFSHELRIDPFEPTINGQTTGRILKGGKQIECKIHYQHVDGYHLVFAWTAPF